MQNVQCGIFCAALNAILLKLQIVGVQNIKLSIKEVGNHLPIILAVDIYGVATVNLEEM